MKCSQCGSENLKKTCFPTSVYGDASMHCSCDSYICLDCGHYEFFNIAKIERYRLKSEEIEKFRRVIIEVGKVISDRDKTIEKIKKQLQELEKDSKNKDITVRQHETITLKIKEIKEKEKFLWNEWDKKIIDVIKFDKDAVNYYKWNDRTKLNEYLVNRVQKLSKEMDEI